ncbi:hypothetical protein VP193E371_P0021 [Vibrio phage 193E37-1]|nr:hypothetical protein VP193E371_P0021 [Vibrio phage 193E37-1]
MCTAHGEEVASYWMHCIDYIKKPSYSNVEGFLFTY